MPNRGHYVFHGAHRFKADHAAELREMGPAASEELLQRLEREAARRRTAAVAAADRKRRVAAYAAPPRAGSCARSSSTLTLCRSLRRARAGEPVTLEALADGVYPLPVFSESFCARLCEEVAHFDASALPRGRPNSMNSAGVLLDELGLSPGLLGPLLRDYLGPLCAALPPLAAAGGSSLSHHKAFVVRYKLGEDEHLEEHYDNSEVTLNVNLGLDFEQGELLFHGRKGAPRAPLVAHGGTRAASATASSTSASRHARRAADHGGRAAESGRLDALAGAPPRARLPDVWVDRARATRRSRASAACATGASAARAPRAAAG